MVGEYVIVHVGFAISRVDEAEAEAIKLEAEARERAEGLAAAAVAAATTAAAERAKFDADATAFLGTLTPNAAAGFRETLYKPVPVEQHESGFVHDPAALNAAQVAMGAQPQLLRAQFTTPSPQVAAAQAASPALPGAPVAGAPPTITPEPTAGAPAQLPAPRAAPLPMSRNLHTLAAHSRLKGVDLAQVVADINAKRAERAERAIDPATPRR